MSDMRFKTLLNSIVEKVFNLDADEFYGSCEFPKDPFHTLRIIGEDKFTDNPTILPVIHANYENKEEKDNRVEPIALEGGFKVTKWGTEDACGSARIQNEEIIEGFEDTPMIVIKSESEVRVVSNTCCHNESGAETLENTQTSGKCRELCRIEETNLQQYIKEEEIIIEHEVLDEKCILKEEVVESKFLQCSLVWVYLKMRFCRCATRLYTAVKSLSYLVCS